MMMNVKSKTLSIYTTLLVGAWLVTGCGTDASSSVPACGDGVVQEGEVCDDGAGNSDAYGQTKHCKTTCDGYAPYCGDGVRNVFESCDDGESNSDAYSVEAHCNASCSAVAPHCGDSVVTDDEVCDEGESNSDDYRWSAQCNTTCSGMAAHCGDGVVSDTETCDDSNTITETCGYGEPECRVCNQSCQEVDGETSYCGDGVVDAAAGEACDDGNVVTETCEYGEESCVVCDATCKEIPMEGAYCGDGVLHQPTWHLEDAWEACDSDEVECSELGLGSGTARCQAGCVAYDTTGCSEQSMVHVPAGPFMMGCDSEVDEICWYGHEEPYHEVYLDGFRIDKYEVTAGEYRACVEAGDCSYPEPTGEHIDHQTYDRGLDTHPMTFVDWNQALVYCQWLGKRLPTEAEWEKAARGTDARIYPWGNSPEPNCDYVNMLDSGGLGSGCGTGGTMEVGSKPLGNSPYGVADMIGNVWEWTADYYTEDYYAESTGINPTGPTWGFTRVMRGGSWGYTHFNGTLRASGRGDHYYVYARSRLIGFRCAQ